MLPKVRQDSNRQGHPHQNDVGKTGLSMKNPMFSISMSEINALIEASEDKALATAHGDHQAAYQIIWLIDQLVDKIRSRTISNQKCGDEVMNSGLASGIGPKSMRVRVFTVGFNKELQQAVILGPDGQFHLSQNSAHRLRNHLCNWLGVPGREDLEKPDGDHSLMALDLGQILGYKAADEEDA